MKRLYLLLFFILFSINIFAQCSPTGLPSSTCSGGSGAYVSGTPYSSNLQTYWWSAGGGSITVDFNNKIVPILRICGTVTITSIIGTLNNPLIIVESTGNLTLSGTTNLNGGTRITNYGTLTTGDVTIQSNNASITNEVGGTINVNGILSLNNNSNAKFVNRGTANINSLVNQGIVGATCLESGSKMTISSANGWTNNTTNAIAFGSASGTACISYNVAESVFNNNLTGSSNIAICRGSSATGMPANNAKWGSATVTSNCTSCSVLLPIDLISFEGIVNNGNIKLNWTTSTEINNDYFTIEKSCDLENFNVLDVVNSIHDSYQLTNYSLFDNSPCRGTTYYRLKQTDFDGKSTEKSLIAINNYFNYNSVKLNKSTNIKLLNSLGQILFDKIINTFTLESIDCLSSGIYVLTIDQSYFKIIK
jgi:hypothetical protein